MDNLTYAYDGNKLNQVSDGISATDNVVDLVPRGNGNYTYYTDGSLKSDENEQISLILYDTYLKQPKEIQLADGRKISHYYDGAGVLLKTVYSTGEYWEYAGIIYKNGQAYQMPTPEGRAVYVSGTWQYEFFYTDHLGNTRVGFRANGNQLLKTAETAFDAFGVVLRGAGQVNGFQNRFEFQDKEKESTFNLNRISLGARTYNSTIGRMDGVDPLADIARRFSPYAYGNNNPLRFIDPSGMTSEEVKDFTYSDGYSNLSARNSTGSVGLSGAYQNNSKDSESPIELQFDKNGNYIGSVDDGRKEASGAVVDEKGNTLSHFEFNDQRDAELFLMPNPALTSVNLWFGNNIAYFMNWAKITGEKSIFTRYFYAGKNSLAGGSMDFVGYLYNYSKSGKTLYLAGNTAYNSFDAGNFLWGHSMRILGFDYASVKIGSETNGFFNSKRQNGQGNGVTWSGDSVEDQRAIRNGYFFNVK